MRRLFSKSLFTYVASIFIVFLFTGGILSQVVDNLLVLILVLGIDYIILVIILLLIFEKYIKPIQKAGKTVAKLVEGNFKARIHHPSNGDIGFLSSKINTLARNLSELSMNEQMQSEQLSTVIDNTESGLVLIDEKGYIHLVNRKFLSMFGKTSKDYIGHLYYQAIDNEVVHETVQQTFLYEENVKNSFTYKKDIDMNYLEIVGAPIFNEHDTLKGAVLVLYDITDLKNIELMRKDFIANVSHELKIPISSVAGYAQRLVDGAKDDTELREKFIGVIHKESKRLNLLIDDLLILSRLEYEDFKLQISKVSVLSLLEDFLPVIRERAEAKNITFTVTGDETIEMEADDEKLKQIVNKLLTNAVINTPNDGTVDLVIDMFDGQVRICVKDTGIGMKQKDLRRIFERFYRVDTERSRNTGGTGLGLAIVKHIVDVHGGTIRVDSQLGKGTTFTVCLPQEQVAEETPMIEFLSDS